MSEKENHGFRADSPSDAELLRLEWEQRRLKEEIRRILSENEKLEQERQRLLSEREKLEQELNAADRWKSGDESDS